MDPAEPLEIILGRLVMTPVELIAKIASLVPPPKRLLLRLLRLSDP